MVLIGDGEVGNVLCSRLWKEEKESFTDSDLLMIDNGCKWRRRYNN